MAKIYENADALCPFYKGEQKNLIYCEGAKGEYSKFKYIAENVPAAREHKDIYCYRGWEGCAHAKGLWEKYWG